MQKYFFIKTDGKYVKLCFNEILYVEGCKNYLKIVTEKKSYLALLTMKRMEQLLPATIFKRVHKSYIVSLDRIIEFDGNTVYLKDKELPIGHMYKEILEKSVLIAQGEVNAEVLAVPFHYLSQKAYAG
ncbi:MAG: LytTR family DNA-binding domain-containing protein [Bacteroidota bacterium]|nr:LytTR family DNA-binding domain-containing protein [Bacteroidota bacterium]